jgi:hypothetical protein
MGRRIGKNLTLTSALVVLLAGVSASSTADDAGMPKLMYASTELRPEPVWVSLEDAIAKDGRLAAEMFDALELTRLSRSLNHARSIDMTAPDETLIEAV